MGHTPGPWRVVRKDVGDRYEVKINVLVGGNGEQVMHLSGGYGHPNPANLALIKAAPELATALDNLMAQFIEVYRGDGWVTDRTYLSACEVLNRIGDSGRSGLPTTDWIRITPAEAFDLLTLAARVDDRTPSEQATLDRLARALEKRA